MNQIFQMSMGLTNLFNGAMQGVGAGVAQLNEVIANSSPMQKLDLMINDLSAKAGMMQHNVRITGDMEGRRAEMNVRDEIEKLRRQKDKLWWDQHWRDSKTRKLKLPTPRRLRISSRSSTALALTIRSRRAIRRR